jgi:hypothetical protein
MIKDEKQYKFTQEWVKKFSQSIAALELDENKKTTDPDGWELLRASLQSQLDTLKKEIAEYETLISHDARTPIVLELDEIYYLPQLLIKARLAAKLTQKELADLARLTEEQIREYEDKDYERASFLDFMAVMDALDIKIQKGEFLVSLDTFRRTPITQEELLSKDAL